MYKFWLIFTFFISDKYKTNLIQTYDQKPLPKEVEIIKQINTGRYKKHALCSIKRKRLRGYCVKNLFMLITNTITLYIILFRFLVSNLLLWSVTIKKFFKKSKPIVPLVKLDHGFVQTVSIKRTRFKTQTPVKYVFIGAVLK